MLSVVHLLQLLGHFEQLLLEVDGSGSGRACVVPALPHHLGHLTKKLRYIGRWGGRDEGKEGGREGGREGGKGWR